MKRTLLIFALLTFPAVARGQAIGGNASIVTVYSQNGRFHLRSIPFDNEFPTPRGKTYVYEQGRREPLYVFERGFDSVAEDSNNLILSDDGETIFYAIPWGADEKREGLRSVNIYRHGLLFKSYTETEVNGCDKKRERCSLIYANYEEVVDRVKSRWGTPHYKKAFKDGVGEEEKFLSDFALFGNGDKVYLTDSKKRVHLFDLKEGALTASDSFENLYSGLKGLARFTKVELVDYEAPTLLEFPRLKGGGNASLRLAALLGLKSTTMSSTRDEQFRQYTVKVTSTLRRDGSLEVEALEVDDGLPREKVAEFFKLSRFDSSHVPAAFEKWHLGEEYFYFRKSDPRLARQERQEELARQRQEYERRLTAETIEGVYIPANLGEALAELDKVLPEVDKSEMRAVKDRKDMILYHLGLGTWMRNNWGLWGGSRLQKYFIDRGVKHPESMSTVILYQYYDWLNGRRETWKEWEKNPGRMLN
jgi:uncharacterized protein DUF6794